MSHLLVVKQIFKYHKGTKGLGSWYLSNESIIMQAYSDSNYGGLQLYWGSVSMVVPLWEEDWLDAHPSSRTA